MAVDVALPELAGYPVLENETHAGDFGVPAGRVAPAERSIEGQTLAKAFGVQVVRQPGQLDYFFDGAACAIRGIVDFDGIDDPSALFKQPPGAIQAVFERMEDFKAATGEGQRLLDAVNIPEKRLVVYGERSAEILFQKNLGGQGLIGFFESGIPLFCRRGFGFRNSPRVRLFPHLGPSDLGEEKPVTISA